MWLPRLRGPIDLRWDGSVYYILGTSLAEGKGYRLLNEPGEIQAIQYPPLLPLVVAAHEWVLGTNDSRIIGQWLRLSFFVIFAVYIVAVYLMLRRYLSLKYALLATLVCLFNVHTYFMSDLLFPEIPFSLATVLFVLCHDNGRKQVYSFLAGFFSILSFALRTVGVALLAGWVAESLLKRQFRKAAIRLIIAVMPILCWQSYISFVESGAEYKSPAYEYQRAAYLFYNVSYAQNIFQFKDSFEPELGYASFTDITERFLNNLKELPASLGGAISVKKVRQPQWERFVENFNFLPANPWPVYLPLIVLGYLIACGIGLQLVSGQPIVAIYVSVSLTLICLTPWPQQFERYLMPLAPFMALALFTTLLKLKNGSSRIVLGNWKSLGFTLIYSVVSLILVVQILNTFLVYKRWHQQVTYSDNKGNKDVYRLFFYHDSYRALDEALDWLKTRAKPGEVVAGSMPHWTYLRTGLKAVMPPFEPNPVKAQILLDSVPVKYLVLDEELAVDTRKYTYPVVEYFPERWKRIYSTSVISELGPQLKELQIYEREPQSPLPRLIKDLQ